MDVVDLIFSHQNKQFMSIGVTYQFNLLLIYIELEKKLFSPRLDKPLTQRLFFNCTYRKKFKYWDMYV